MAQPPILPEDDLRAALPHGHTAHATIDRLRDELESPSPDRRSIETHVTHLRSLPELAAIIANWWDDPETQRFIATLNSMGL
ncbi:MAG TPA: hypothetical protein VIN40_11115 [Candidatus Tyrphobacter sp.]